jgi:hypothetical protein
MSEMPVRVANSQLVRALEMANRVRRVRSMLKTRIAQGQLEAAEVILTCPSEIASVQIARLLASQRAWGEVRCRAFLAQVGVREDKSIGSLTDRQRRAVASLLTRESAQAKFNRFSGQHRTDGTCPARWRSATSAATRQSDLKVERERARRRAIPRSCGCA